MVREGIVAEQGLPSALVVTYSLDEFGDAVGDVVFQLVPRTGAVFDLAVPPEVAHLTHVTIAEWWW